MSELKATTAQEIVRIEKDCDYMDELFGGVKMPPTQVYIKSEADKVIADLKESHNKDVEQLLIKIVELKKQVHDYAQGLYVIQAKTEKEARHSNYKRCLAMAKLCNEKWLVHNFAEIPTKLGFYDKWEKRWLKIAEKFKDVK